jgi:hypothetical protein
MPATDCKIVYWRWLDLRYPCLSVANSYLCNRRNLWISYFGEIALYRIFIVGSPNRIQVRRTSVSVVAAFACRVASPSAIGGPL